MDGSHLDPTDARSQNLHVQSGQKRAYTCLGGGPPPPTHTHMRIHAHTHTYTLSCPLSVERSGKMATDLQSSLTPQEFKTAITRHLQEFSRTSDYYRKLELDGSQVSKERAMWRTRNNRTLLVRQQESFDGRNQLCVCEMQEVICQGKRRKSIY